MPIKAFVLVNAEAALTKEVVAAIRKVSGVAEAYEVMGPYDILAVIQVQDLLEVSEILGQHIRRIPGVQSTLTCVTMP